MITEDQLKPGICIEYMRMGPENLPYGMIVDEIKNGNVLGVAAYPEEGKKVQAPLRDVLSFWRIVADPSHRFDLE